MRQGYSQHVRFAALVAAAAVTLGACDNVRPPEDSSETAAIEPWSGTPSNHLGCNAGRRFTGGGRVDPDGVGKVTFGFQVDGRDFCEGGSPRGNLQVVYHQTQSLVHAITVTHFSSFIDPVAGECGEFDGTARVKHVNEGGDWHEHHYFAEVCDNGEPGHGTDRFTLTLDGERGQHENVWQQPLTGGNIQSHK